MDQGSPPRSALRAGLLLLGFALGAKPVYGQAVPAIWRPYAEVGGLLGGTWLSGPRSPTVSTDPGFSLGIGISRGITPDVSSGVSMRVASQGLSLSEVGATWTGGTLTEANVVGQLSLSSRRRTRRRLALDLGGGIAVLSGAHDILPFLDASNIAPLGEMGLSLHNGKADADASRRDMAFFVRYSTLRLDANVVNAATTTGWVHRVTLGLRVTR